MKRLAEEREGSAAVSNQSKEGGEWVGNMGGEQGIIKNSEAACNEQADIQTQDSADAGGPVVTMEGGSSTAAGQGRGTEGGAEAPEGRRGKVGKMKTTFRYKMPSVYSDFLKNAVLADKNLKGGSARSMMISSLGLDGKQLPINFPTEEQVKTRVSGLKYTHNGGKIKNKQRKEGVKQQET